MHEHHRSRMKDKFFNFGEELFCDHEIIEMLLFFSLSRVNTNQYAHELLDRFGSLEGLFSASISDIVSIKGIGYNSAVLIKLVGAIVRRILAKPTPKKPKMRNLSVTSDYIVNLFGLGNEERLYMISLDNSLSVIESTCIIDGAVNYSSATVAEIIKRAVKQNASSVILAHNHPKGIAVPSSMDLESTHRINEGLRYTNISLIEHFVVSGDRCNPMLHSYDSGAKPLAATLSDE